MVVLGWVVVFCGIGGTVQFITTTRNQKDQQGDLKNIMCSVLSAHLISSHIFSLRFSSARWLSEAYRCALYRQIRNLTIGTKATIVHPVLPLRLSPTNRLPAVAGRSRVLRTGVVVVRQLIFRDKTPEQP